MSDEVIDSRVFPEFLADQDAGGLFGGVIPSLKQVFTVGGVFPTKTLGMIHASTRDRRRSMQDAFTRVKVPYPNIGVAVTEFVIRQTRGCPTDFPSVFGSFPIQGGAFTLR